MMVAGVGMDAVVNCLFFIAGVIPGHIHGFYITCTYFHRKSKVRKGRYPGDKRGMIYSSRVLNGDTTSAHVRELWETEQREKADKEMRRRVRSETPRSWGWSSSGSSRNGNVAVQNEQSWHMNERNGHGQKRQKWWI